jgi:hypothetical protein
MPKPKQFERKKKAPFRDAFLCVIICEGESREPEYFKHFDGLSSKIKIVPIKNSTGKSSPIHLIENALAAEQDFDLNQDDQVWFVIDTDRWGKQVHLLRKECEEKTNWQVVQSNPCFEVWLYFHVKRVVPTTLVSGSCKEWKSQLHTMIPGGFKSSNHTDKLSEAIANAKENLKEDGYWPMPGCTQVWRLGEVIERFIRKER